MSEDNTPTSEPKAGTPPEQVAPSSPHSAPGSKQPTPAQKQPAPVAAPPAPAPDCPDKGSRPVLSAILGLLGGAAAAALIGWLSDSSVERQKFDYTVIQSALQGTPEERVERLNFLLDMGLIADEEIRENLKKRLDEFSKDPKGTKLPELPGPAITSPSPLPARVLPNMDDLAGYKVKIFYAADKPEDKEAATELYNILKKELTDVTVEIGVAGDTASSDQIRYERGSEDAAAAALKQFLDDAYPDRRFRPQTVTTKIPRYLSIFFKTE